MNLPEFWWSARLSSSSAPCARAHRMTSRETLQAKHDPEEHAEHRDDLGQDSRVCPSLCPRVHEEGGHVSASARRARVSLSEGFGAGELTLTRRKPAGLCQLLSICRGGTFPSSRRAGRQKEGAPPPRPAKDLQALEELQRGRCVRVMRREAVAEQVVQDRSACSVIKLHPRWDGMRGKERAELKEIPSLVLRPSKQYLYRNRWPQQQQHYYC